MRAKKWITNNIGLKILSLTLAVITWFYTSWELAKLKDAEEKAIIDMLHYDVISKKLPIQLTIVGEVKQGYKLVIDEITISPKNIIVIGPENLLEEVTSARTIPIDVSEYSKGVKKEVPLAPIARGIVLKDDLVSISLPIIKTGGDDASKAPEQK